MTTHTFCLIQQADGSHAEPTSQLQRALPAMDYASSQLQLVRLPAVENRGGGVLTPNYVTPVFIYILDLEHSEKLGVTFRAHSFLLENLKKVLKNHHFLEKFENLYSLMVLAKYF